MLAIRTCVVALTVACHALAGRGRRRIGFRGERQKTARPDADLRGRVERRRPTTARIESRRPGPKNRNGPGDLKGVALALAAQLTHDPYYTQWQLQAGEQPGELVLLATPSAGAEGTANPVPERFVGAIAGEALVLTALAPAADRPARISLRLVAGGDRLLVLYEKRSAGDSYTRLAEVGSTRKGSSFAKASLGGPECVVTGGLGTIPLTHKGKTYHVCCGGCRDLFLEDPDGVLEEYRQRKAAEQADKRP